MFDDFRLILAHFVFF